jgi:hypothetical protein
MYVLVKDKIDSDNIRIQYVQTDVKRADFFTLQGSPFRKSRDCIIKVDPTYYDPGHRRVLKTDSQSSNAKPGMYGLDIAKPGGQAARDDLNMTTPYRSQLLKRTEGESVRKQRMIHDDHSFPLTLSRLLFSI